jgi:hypothetical protein
MGDSPLFALSVDKLPKERLFNAGIGVSNQTKPFLGGHLG